MNVLRVYIYNGERNAWLQPDMTWGAFDTAIQYTEILGPGFLRLAEADRQSVTAGSEDTYAMAVLL